MCKEATGNKTYKDNVFRLLFGEESKLRQQCCIDVIFGYN